MAFDEAKIYVRSGNGGDGMMSFRREKYVPRGGPSGGDGGNGGDIILRVNPKLSTLSNFEHKVHFKAASGERGGSANKTGGNAAHLIIDVPPGTIIRDAEDGTLIADLIQPEQQIVIVRGGRGGRGNARFATAANQAPRIAEKGEPGIERWLKLELKLIADVGIVGMPNAGKSTLLSVISNAKPKIASYPFTTLEPNLGVVIYDDKDLVFADIPGLIEGAHMGIGLGHSFLRHVQRTRVLIHLLDGTSENVLADYSQIKSELALYDEKLIDKPQIVVFSKMDLPEVQARWPEVQQQFVEKGIPITSISAVTQHNTRQLVQQVYQLVASLPDAALTEAIEELPVYEMSEETMVFEVQREGENVFRVTGKRIERAAAMTYWDYEDAVMRFQNILETLGVSKALQDAGVKVGDTVFIGDYELEWSD